MSIKSTKDDISFQPNWSIKRVKMATRARSGFWLDTVYEYNSINDEYLKIKHRRDQHNRFYDEEEMTDLDPHMWNEFVDTLENGRQFVYDTCRENGVNEFESHFLSIKWVISTLKKFGGKFFKAMDAKNNKSDYHRTALKEAIIILRRRFENMAIQDNYVWSPKAANGKLSQFRKEASWDIARELAEDTGIILHAKLTL